MGEIEGWMTF